MEKVYLPLSPRGVGRRCFAHYEAGQEYIRGATEGKSDMARLLFRLHAVDIPFCAQPTSYVLFYVEWIHFSECNRRSYTCVQGFPVDSLSTRVILDASVDSFGQHLVDDWPRYIACRQRVELADELMKDACLAHKTKSQCCCAGRFVRAFVTAPFIT